MKKNFFLIIYLILGVAVLAGAYYTLFYGFGRVPSKPADHPNVNLNIPDGNTNLPNGPDTLEADLRPTSSPHLRLEGLSDGATVASPLRVTGEAAGWYFEGSFPVKLLDANGKVLVTAPAKAVGDWMTNDFVPFSVTLTFAAPATPLGTLVLKNDNPSGDPSRDEIVTVPVIFATPAACKPTGCSGQICSDQNVITDCLYTAAYACYKKAKCERQSDGQCGWTQTASLKACLAASQ